MSEPLLVGTGNRDKAAELAHLLEGLPWRVISLADLEPVAEPVEDGESFLENSLKKAHYYSRHFGMCCVADDSGLVVDALDGAPGVYSARYAGEGCTYRDNNEKLLRELANLPENKRTARFVCCAVFVEHSGRTHSETGVVEGRIALECRGDNGFGYDPLFIPRGHEQTFGEMPPELKHSMSHRGRAFGRLRKYLETLL